MLALCKLVDVSVCASQAAARKAQPLWQQLGFQAKIYERKKSTNDLIQTLTSTRMRADTLYIILVWFHSGIRACNI